MFAYVKDESIRNVRHEFAEDSMSFFARITGFLNGRNGQDDISTLGKYILGESVMKYMNYSLQKLQSNYQTFIVNGSAIRISTVSRYPDQPHLETSSRHPVAWELHIMSDPLPWSLSRLWMLSCVTCLFNVLAWLWLCPITTDASAGCWTVAETSYCHWTCSAHHAEVLWDCTPCSWGIYLCLPWCHVCLSSYWQLPDGQRRAHLKWNLPSVHFHSPRHWKYAKAKYGRSYEYLGDPN